MIVSENFLNATPVTGPVLPFDQLFVGHHPMVGRWKQAIDTFQPEWLPESDGLGARHSCRRAPRLMAAIPGGYEFTPDLVGCSHSDLAAD